MTVREAVAVIENISYRPGWKLEVNLGYGFADAVMIVLSALVEDAYGGPGSRRINVMMHKTLTATELQYFDIPRLLDWVRRFLFLEMEDHESREFFKFHGERVFDPHKGER